MAESLSTYKRRPRKPLSELKWNASDALDDPESQVSLLSSDGDETGSMTVSKKKRKIWSDRSLSKERRRSDAASSGRELNLKDKASEWVGTLFGRKDKNRGDSSEGNFDDQSDGDSDEDQVEVKTREWLQSPVEFVKEKRAMFAAIDSFELEFEEVDPDDKNGESTEREGEIPKSPEGLAKPPSNCEVENSQLGGDVQSKT